MHEGAADLWRGSIARLLRAGGKRAYNVKLSLPILALSVCLILLPFSVALTARAPVKPPAMAHCATSDHIEVVTKSGNLQEIEWFVFDQEV
jgi:hypothetical protein